MLGAPLSGAVLLHAGLWGTLQGHQDFWSWQREDTQKTDSQALPALHPTLLHDP